MSIKNHDGLQKDLNAVLSELISLSKSFSFVCVVADSTLHILPKENSYLKTKVLNYQKLQVNRADDTGGFLIKNMLSLLHRSKTNEESITMENSVRDKICLRFTEYKDFLDACVQDIF